LEVRGGQTQDLLRGGVGELLEGLIEGEKNEADVFVADGDFLIRGAGEEKDDGFADERFRAAVAEEISDFMREGWIEGNVRQAGLFFEFAQSGGAIVFIFFDMTFGEIPVPAVVEQEKKTTAGIIVVDDNTGGSFVASHAEDGF
jgi:hypothetical protein